MKAWSQPEMEELNVRATAYSPKGYHNRKSDHYNCYDHGQF